VAYYDDVLCLCILLRNTKVNYFQVLVYDVLNDNEDHLTDKSILAISDDLIRAVEFWQTAEVDQDSLDAANEYYGGPDTMIPFTSPKSVITALKRLSLTFKKLSEKRSPSAQD